MKLFFSVIFLASLGFTAQAQSSWFGNTSCSDDGAVIADQAFTSFINVEQSMAIGMARAALLIDEGCGIAKLVQANASGDSQDALLSEASEMSLSSDERLWLDLTQSDDPWQPAATAIVESGNEAPVFSWMSSWDTNRGTVAENMEDFAEAYPDHAASAYNMLAYAYADAGWGVEEADMVRALRYLDLYDAAHEGPNAADSRSEILWNAGEAGAWTAIRSAVDKGGNPSMYADRAGTIWRAMNEENLAKAIHDQVQAFWSGSDEEADMEARAALLAPTSSHCDSNLEACYSATKDEVLAALGAGAEWLSLEVSDVDVTFNSDYRTAVATHMNAGQYKTDDDNVVEYRARASSVWSLDPWSGDWLLIHGNFAPSGGAGIPSTK